MQHILLVDDDPDLAEALSWLLDGMGFRVEIAHGGVEALEYAKREMPSLVISDVRMPNGDGIELFRSLRALPGGGQIPFAFMSGFISDRDDEIADIRTDPSGFRFFQKPLDMASFREFLHRFQTT